MKILLFLFLICINVVSNATTIEFIVSAAPGGPADTTTRKLTEILQKKINNKLLILNKPGASHTIAYNYIINSNKPTLIISTSEIKKHKVYNQIQEISNVGNFSMYLFVSKKSNITTFDDLKNIAMHREILFGHSGHLTFSFAGLEYICNILINCLPIPYRSGNNGIIGLTGGEIDAYTIVSYGSTGYLENKNLILIKKFNLPNNQLVLYSKNIDPLLKNKIKKIIEQQIDINFLSSVGLEK